MTNKINNTRGPEDPLFEYCEKYHTPYNKLTDAINESNQLLEEFTEEHREGFDQILYDLSELMSLIWEEHGNFSSSEMSFILYLAARKLDKAIKLFNAASIIHA